MEQPKGSCWLEGTMDTKDLTLGCKHSPWNHCQGKKGITKIGKKVLNGTIMCICGILLETLHHWEWHCKLQWSSIKENLLHKERKSWFDMPCTHRLWANGSLQHLSWKSVIWDWFSTLENGFWGCCTSLVWIFLSNFCDGCLVLDDKYLQNVLCNAWWKIVFLSFVESVWRL